MAKARLTKAAMNALRGPDLRFIVLMAGINDTAAAIYKNPPGHWAGVIAKDKEAQQKFLSLNLDAPEITTRVFTNENPSLLEDSWTYLKAIQKAVNEGADRLPKWDEIVGGLVLSEPEPDASGDEAPGSEDSEMVSSRRSRRGMRSRTRRDETDAPETPEVEKEETVVEPEPEPEVEEKVAPKRRGRGRARTATPKDDVETSKEKVVEPPVEPEVPVTSPIDMTVMFEKLADGLQKIVGDACTISEGIRDDVKALITEVADIKATVANMESMQRLNTAQLAILLDCEPTDLPDDPDSIPTDWSDVFDLVPEPPAED